MYKTYANPFYNPTDTTPKPGDNQNWEDIQRGFYRVKEKIEEGGSGNGVTVIQIVGRMSAGTTEYRIVNLDEVRDKIGRLTSYPQIAVVTIVGISDQPMVYYAVDSTIGTPHISARFVTVGITGATPIFSGLSIDTIDNGETWTITTKDF